jgi:adenosylmethionine-8-amino-7-oxononanoate aminotransferase
VQHVIQADNLLANVKEMGQVLAALLSKAIAAHPNVGNIRGRGLFWGVEFIKDKAKKTPFSTEANVAMAISELGISERYNINVYPGTGTVNGIEGDHIIIAPAYNVTRQDIEFIVGTLRRLIWDFFQQLMYPLG